MPPSSNISPDNLVEGELLSRLDNTVAWPVKPFKLEMEEYEIYQNTTGIALDESDEIERETIDRMPFYFKPGTTPDEIRSSKVHQHTARIYKFAEETGEFANLVAYVTLCKIYDELYGSLQPLDLYPENDSPMILSHTERVPDAILRFPTEYVPVEVYNGMDYLNDRNDKWDQLHDLSTDEDDMSDCSPILINRRSESGEFKDELRKQNVTVIDTDCVFTSEALYEEYEDAIESLHLAKRYEIISEIEGATGVKLVGVDYDVQSATEAKNDDDDRDAESQRQARLTPPSEMLSDIDLIPPQYRKRVRGGVQLHYVNTLYRQTTEPTERASALVIQQMYNNLLRAQAGVPQPDSIDAGYQDASEQFTKIISRQPEEAVREQARLLVSDLVNERIIFKRDGKLSARKSTHPQQDFSFDTH